MIIPPNMPPRYADVQDYYPPLSSPRSRSSSPRSPSPPPSLALRSPSLAPSSFLDRDRSAHRSSRTYASYRAPTSIPLDDNFDAPTTEAPTEWALRSAGGGGGGGGGDGHPEYDESVTGYQNYVVEMERMLEGQMESAARAQERIREAAREREKQQELHDRERDRQARQRKTSVSATPSRRMSTSPTTLRRIDTSINGGVRSPGPGHGGAGGRRSFGQHTHMHTHAPAPSVSPLPVRPPPPPENARQVSGKKGRLELVEQRVLEDSAARTISLWRERVAASSAGGSRCGESNVDGAGGDEPQIQIERRDGAEEASVAGSRAHRRMPSSGDVSRLRRVVSDQARYAGSVQDGRSRSGSVRGDQRKHGRTAYERSEYMVSYRDTKGGIGIPKELFPHSEAGSTVPVRELRSPSSPTMSKTYDSRAPPSPTLRRHVPRKSLDRSEYMIAYPQTPPLTGSQASSGSPTGKPRHSLSPPPLRSPLQSSFREMRTPSAVPASDVTGTGALKATTTSSVEAILAACDPSLLHLAPVLDELGIKRVDHLRAVARLSEETRDREVKEQALRRGVTVVEWAIFLDKLQSL